MVDMILDSPPKCAVTPRAHRFPSRILPNAKQLPALHKCLLFFCLPPGVWRTGTVRQLLAAELQLACCVAVQQKLTVGKDLF